MTNSEQTPAQGRTSFERATLCYDSDFRTALTESIFEAIAHQSEVTDAAVIVFRMGEIADALADCLATFMSLDPKNDVPSHLRAATERLSKKFAVMFPRGAPPVTSINSAPAD